ncbi:GlcG/HbpS family heme-binding protein [Candidatus Phyllobacterium onerii]|uniref:GlcG/HbpS family heme-binding protein n=1 Tax=Candidatus Phyllobacterium onerii TaxID=3020828 RepID=UPI00232C7E9F|nr:heme-binding protein [Phyllobacterium sp. IY22]
MILTTAETVVAAAKAAVSEHSLPPMSISIVDSGAHLVAFARMDGTFIASIDVAHRKARTAALFATDTAALGPILRPGSAAYTLENSNGGLIAFGGGVLLKDDTGKMIGAVGVSGGTVEDDEFVAQAAAAALT